MITKTLKIFIIVLSSALLVLGALKTMQACGYFEPPDNKDYSVFAPEIIHQPDKAPFFLSYHSYYGREGYSIPETTPTMTERNTEEWVAFFNSKIKSGDIEWLIYKSTVQQLELIRRNFAGDKINIDTLNKTFLSQIRSERNILDVLDYIIIARKAEKYFNPDYSSWEPISYDSVFIDRLIPVFQNGFLNAKNTFLKQRYGFQVSRALCIGGQYKKCIDFFDNAFKPATAAGSMYYRSLGFKARALYKMKDYSQANYLYSYLYEHDPCGRYQAFQSFHPQEEADWEATLNLAGSSRETEVLWHLLGIYADPVRGMKEIYSLNPKSDLLPLLLVRSVNLAEEISLNNPIRYDNFYYEDYSTPGQAEMENPYKVIIDSVSQKTLLGFINKVITEKKVEKPAIWQLSSAYLLLLNGAYRSADEMLSKLNIDSKDSLLLGQAGIIKGILTVRKLTTIDAGMENLVYEHIKKIQSLTQPELRKENALRYMLSRLSMVYNKKGDLIKTELCYPRAKNFYGSAADVQQMINFISRKNLNPLENYMVNQYPLKLSDLYHIKAVALLYNYEFKGAVLEFEKSAGAGSQELYGNPFNIHITDCHDCDHQAKQKTKYTKYSFAKKMIELKARGDTSSNMEERAQNYFLYANGLYNMTWYGNGRVIHETPVSMSDYFTYYTTDEEKRRNNLRKTNFFNCSKVLASYQKAFSLSKDKEFRARCIWMSAKCEHNLWLEGLEEETPLNNDFVAGEYFNRMKKEYADTKYYRDVISECGYFCTFVTHSNKCIRDSLSLRR